MSYLTISVDAFVPDNSKIKTTGKFCQTVAETLVGTLADLGLEGEVEVYTRVHAVADNYSSDPDEDLGQDGE